MDKFWTNTELQGLMAKQEYQKTILPVLHEMDHRELAKVSPVLAGLVHGSTREGYEVLAKDIAAAVGNAQELKRNQTVALDVSHRQSDWNNFVPSARSVIKGGALEINSDIAAQIDELLDCRVLVMALGCHAEFSRQDVQAVRDWVHAGGGLFLLGFYLPDTHHLTNPNALARALGFSFRSDIVMPPGRTSRRECQDQAFDTNGALAVSVRVPATNDHPITRGVRELSVLSACSIDPINAPDYQIRVRPDSAVVVEATGRPNEQGYLLQIHEYVPTLRTEPTVLAAWQYGQGRVVAAGTWKLFTLDQRDNIRLVENVLAWLRSPNKPVRRTASGRL